MNNPVYWTSGMTLEAMERLVIQQAFSVFRNNKTATANALGISVRTLDSKLEKYAEEQQVKDQNAAELKKRTADFHMRSRGLPAPTLEAQPYLPVAPPQVVQVSPPPVPVPVAEPITVKRIKK